MAILPAEATPLENYADFSFAFQPIVDIRTGLAHSYEALVRGLANESAYQVIQRYTGDRLAKFDAVCRVRAIEVAAKLGMDTNLNLNFLPSAASDPTAGLSSTVDAALRHGFPLNRLVVEATEGEAIANPAQFAKIMNEYRRVGIQLAIDDFGAGHAGLNLLAEFQPDVLKLDMLLVRDINASGPRQAIVRGIAQVCNDLGIDIVVEGVETVEEYRWFQSLGVTLYQGYLFAKPLFEGMPVFQIPDLKKSAASR